MLVHPNDENIRFNSLIQQQTRKHTKTPSLCDIEPYASHRWSKQCCFCFHWCDHQISESSKACREDRTVKSNSVKKWASYDILIQKILVRWRLYLVHHFSCYFLQYVCYIFNLITYCWMSASLSSAFPHCFSVMPQRLHCNSSKHHLGEAFNGKKTTQSGDFHDNSMPVGLWNPYNGYINPYILLGWWVYQFIPLYIRWKSWKFRPTTHIKIVANLRETGAVDELLHLTHDFRHVVVIKLKKNSLCLRDWA